MDHPTNYANRAVSFEIKGNKAILADRLEIICEKTLHLLKLDFSNVTESVICLIDDQDYSYLRQRIGAANKGLFCPLRGQALNDLIPQYFWDSVFRFDYLGLGVEPLFDCLIYVHGSTASSEVGFTLTLAHELQHFAQYSLDRSMWAVDRLLAALQAPHNDGFKKWVDFPIEREARVVAKRVALEMHGKQAVDKHIKEKLDERVDNADVADWEFLLSAESDGAYDAVEATKALVRQYRPQLALLQAQDWNDCPEVLSLDFACQHWQ